MLSFRNQTEQEQQETHRSTEHPSSNDSPCATASSWKTRAAKRARHIETETAPISLRFLFKNNTDKQRKHSSFAPAKLHWLRVSHQISMDLETSQMMRAAEQDIDSSIPEIGWAKQTVEVAERTLNTQTESAPNEDPNWNEQQKDNKQRHPIAWQTRQTTDDGSQHLQDKPSKPT
jgi:hypothetical protein